MENLELDIINHRYIYDAHPFLSGPIIQSLSKHQRSEALAVFPTTIPQIPSGSTGSSDCSERYSIDGNSSDGESIYSSDREMCVRESYLRTFHRSRSYICEKKIHPNVNRPTHVIHQRQAANLRERKRMQNINDAFEGLRTHLPTLPYEKRLSKVDTLKLAISYIRFLTELVCNEKDSVTYNHGTVTKYTNDDNSKKIILHSYCGDPYIAHSLSWSRKAEKSSTGTMFAKVWTPEDPRSTKNSRKLVTKSEKADVRILCSSINRQRLRKDNNHSNITEFETLNSWTKESSIQVVKDRIQTRETCLHREYVIIQA
ncbi:uncharacterized protein LOC130671252 isoform X2 [Microplitis mediator]|uniref:uncharacterized protein LOC130671252 isoform X2 n=1 Tax=Microplitis mediator TaxID=375433 RepID=UPI0025573885|nr:uncharacterized protein LOC130671252 isoform X2 [Microplitis mediator]